MRVQPRPDELIGQPFQPSTHATRLDRPQHLHTQSNVYPHASRRPDQKQIDQHFTGDFARQFIHLWRCKHAYPGDHCRQIDEQQWLIAQHQQAMGDGVLAQFQQLVQFGLGDVLQQFLAIGLEVRQQVVQLSDVIPEVIERLTDPTRKRHALHRTSLERRGAGEVFPSRLEGLRPFITQAMFQPGDHRLIRRIQRLDVCLGNVGVKGDLVALIADALVDFKNAAGIDGSSDRGTERLAVRSDGLQHHRRIADRNKPRAFKHVHQGQ